MFLVVNTFFTLLECNGSCNCCEECCEKYFGCNFGSKKKEEENKTKLKFNITNGTVREIYKDKVPANMEQICYVYDELLKATKLASEITTEKMKKKHDVKKITINN